MFKFLLSISRPNMCLVIVSN